MSQVVINDFLGIDNDDELYLAVIQKVKKRGLASHELLQRTFKVGYARSARLMDRLEDDGIIGLPNGGDPRKVNDPSIPNPPIRGSDDYEKALYVTEHVGHITVSMLQRRLRIGYECAMQLLDRLEDQRVIGAADGAKPRVFVPRHNRKGANGDIGRELVRQGKFGIQRRSRRSDAAHQSCYTR
jgi:DNA segregation ATPase FtsK/SpoIIIE-like protein